MKVRLIYPSVRKDGMAGEYQHPQLWFPLLTFPILAAYTPGDVDVEIIDEVIEEINFDDPVDLVGLTAMTHTAPRAYEIAEEYRKRGVKTIIGGFHASALPDDAQCHVDSVVIGEAEETWPLVVEDFRNGVLKPRYVSSGLFDMNTYKFPRLELLSKYWLPPERYQPPYYPSLNIVEMSRGCPFKCDYCAVTYFYGNQYRFRPVEAVLEEIRFRKLQNRQRFVCFNDDNVFGNKTYFRELLKGMRKLNISWGAQMSINVAKNPDLLKMMVDSGCQSVGLGIESISQDSLASVNKLTNKVDEYDRLFDRFRDYKLRIYLGLIVGFDADTESVFPDTLAWINQHLDAIIYVNFHVLTPFPGSNLYLRLKEQKRIFDWDWRHYDTRHVVFHPKSMSVQTLQDGFDWINGEIKKMNFSNWQRWY